MRLPQVYADVLLSAFTVLALWESFQPRRRGTRPTLRRWGRNGGLAALSDAAGLLVRVTPLVVAAAVIDSPYGLLNRSTVPFALQFLASIVLLDFVRYLQHRGMHVVNAFWRLHQVHHSDEHVDVTTGLRFHPVEAIVTQLSYAAVVALLAPPVLAVMVVDLALIVQNLFGHANVRLPQLFERRLRMIVITPEMHRVHHSVRRDEQDANFGVIFPFWDHLCGTYCPAPADDDARVRFGLKRLQDDAPLSLMALLRMPFGGGGSRPDAHSAIQPGKDRRPARAADGRITH
jgi:sterol desaturase/sphingolipid hydroxylase (fatty acid hydroxylase superfamily)